MKKTGISINFKGLFTQRTEVDEDDEDQTPMEHRIPFAWWTTGLFLSTVMSCAILATLFNMNVGEAILALILGFIFSFIGVQSSGATDINPVSTVAKVCTLLCLINANVSHLPYARHPNLSLVVLERARTWH